MKKAEAEEKARALLSGFIVNASELAPIKRGEKARDVVVRKVTAALLEAVEAERVAIRGSLVKASETMASEEDTKPPEDLIGRAFMRGASGSLYAFSCAIASRRSPE